MAIKTQKTSFTLTSSSSQDSVCTAPTESSDELSCCCSEQVYNERTGCLKITTQEASIRHIYSGSEDTHERQRKKNRVGFSTAEIHVHETTLGDNPMTVDGPPLALEWNALRSLAFNLDEYEEVKRRTHRRTREEMRIPGELRAEWLINDAGISRRRLVKVAMEMQAIQQSRQIESAKALAELKQQEENWQLIQPLTQLEEDIDSFECTV